MILSEAILVVERFIQFAERHPTYSRDPRSQRVVAALKLLIQEAVKKQ